MVDASCSILMVLFDWERHGKQNPIAFKILENAGSNTQPT